MFDPPPIKDLGFIILCPDRNPGALRNSLSAIDHYAYDRDSIAIVGSDATKSDVEEMKTFCPTYKGKNKITSLINAGMRHLKSEWGMFLFGGSRINKFLERKISHFATDSNDIIYPILDGNYNFVDASLNGFMMKKSTFKKIGKWPDNEMKKAGFDEFKFAKLLWSLDAIKVGCQFKGIVGLRII